VFGIFPFYIIGIIIYLPNSRTKHVKSLITYLLISGLLLLFYGIFWVFPNKDFFIKLITIIGTSKYYAVENWNSGIWLNIKQVFLNWENTYHTYLFLLSMLVSIIILLDKKCPLWIRKAITFIHVIFVCKTKLH
jgi:hypothetical protein